AFGVSWSAFVIFIVVIGGIGTIEGPILGTLLFFALRELLADYGTWYLIVLGLVAVLAMLACPSGAGWRSASTSTSFSFRWSAPFPRHSPGFAGAMRSWGCSKWAVEAPFGALAKSALGRTHHPPDGRLERPDLQGDALDLVGEQPMTACVV